MNGSTPEQGSGVSLKNINKTKRNVREHVKNRRGDTRTKRGASATKTPSSNGQEARANGYTNKTAARNKNRSWKVKTHSKSGAVTASLIRGLQEAQGENDALKELAQGPVLDLSSGPVNSTTTSCIGTTITIGGSPAVPVAVTTTTSTPPPPSIPVPPPAPPPVTLADIQAEGRKRFDDAPPPVIDYQEYFDMTVGRQGRRWRFSFQTPDVQTFIPYWVYLMMSYAYIFFGLGQLVYNSYQTFALWLILKSLSVCLTYYFTESLKKTDVGPIGLLVTLGVNTFFGFATRTVLGLDSYSLPTWVSVVYWVLVAIAYFFGLNAYPFPCRSVTHKYKLHEDGIEFDPCHDERQDVMALGKMTHSRPLRAKMIYTRSGLYFGKHDGSFGFFGYYKPQVLHISVELFVQLTNPRILQHGSSEEENSRHLNRQASALHSVNISRYWHLENEDVNGDTVLVAYGYLQYTKQKRQDCPFYRAPLAK